MGRIAGDADLRIGLTLRRVHLNVDRRRNRHFGRRRRPVGPHDVEAVALVLIRAERGPEDVSGRAVVVDYFAVTPFNQPARREIGG